MKRINKVKVFTIALFVILSIVYYEIPDRRDGTEYKEITIDASFDNGDKKEYTVKIPSYAHIYVGQSRGGHMLNTWEYCMVKGIVKCEKTLIYGVQRFDHRK